MHHFPRGCTCGEKEGKERERENPRVFNYSRSRSRNLIRRSSQLLSQLRCRPLRLDTADEAEKKKEEEEEEEEEEEGE